MANSVNSSITDFIMTLNSLSGGSSGGIYSTLELSSYSVIKDKAIDVISKIDKINNLEYKISGINKLFLDMRGSVKDELNMASGENSSIDIGQMNILMQKKLNYLKQYDIELRTAINNKKQNIPESAILRVFKVLGCMKKL